MGPIMSWTNNVFLLFIGKLGQNYDGRPIFHTVSFRGNAIALKKMNEMVECCIASRKEKSKVVTVPLMKIVAQNAAFILDFVLPAARTAFEVWMIVWGSSVFKSDLAHTVFLYWPFLSFL